MPTVAVVDGIRIEFFFHEHPPPHFHAISGGERATLDIEDGSVLKGNLAMNKLRVVQERAGLRKPALLEAWDKCRKHERPGKIR